MVDHCVFLPFANSFSLTATVGLDLISTIPKKSEENLHSSNNWLILMPMIRLPHLIRHPLNAHQQKRHQAKH